MSHGWEYVTKDMCFSFLVDTPQCCPPCPSGEEEEEPAGDQEVDVEARET